MSKSSARKLRRMSSGPQDAKVERRRLALVFGIFMLLAAPTVFLVQSRSYPTASPFKLIDITGAGYAGDFLLPDHNGVTRSLKDFNGEVAVVFFGFKQCPDVCPTTLTEVVQARKLMGSDGAKLKAIFVTVDPERDTFPVLKTYMANFDPPSWRCGQTRASFNSWQKNSSSTSARIRGSRLPRTRWTIRRPASSMTRGADCVCMRGMALEPRHWPTMPSCF